jgi:hypothetical protein
VFLTVLVLLLQFRFAGSWSDGVQLLVSGGAALFVLAMALPVPTDGGGPRAYLATLYVSAWGLSLVALLNLADVLGAASLSAGTITWIAAVLTGLGMFFSRRRDAASGTLLGAVAGTVAFVELVNWTVGLDSFAEVRRAMLVVAIVLGLGALWQRVRGPAHGVQLLNALGLVVLFIAGTLGLDVILGLGGAVFGGPVEFDAHVGIGWEILVLATGISLVAAGAADGERGNVVIGIANLALFTVLASSGDLIGWPILLALAAGTLLVIGLRPSTPMPPEPEAGDGPGPLVTLRPS